MTLTLTPTFDDFEAAFKSRKPQLVWTRLIDDVETPVSAMMKLMEEGEPCFLLESVQGGETRGRYSMIGLKPDLIWRCFRDRSEICHHDKWDESKFKPQAGNSLDNLRALLEENRLTLPPGLPPMAAGLIGYMNYDMVKQMEKIPDENPDPIGIPDGCFMRPKLMLVFDAALGEIFIVTSIYDSGSRGDAKSAYAAAQKRIEEIIKKLEAPLKQRQLHPADTKVPPLEFKPNMTKAHYFGMIDKAKEYIRAGDIFQVVLAQRFMSKYELPHFALYRSLRHMNPSPFLFFLNFGGFSLVGSSPEIMVRLRDGAVTVRPIAGTRKRGKNVTEDQELAADLLSDPKELAEHLMLLDLGRNDVGRISKPGTVKVTEQMRIENYSHVMHIVSNVEGRLSSDYDALDALVAGFPAGTVSGAPKIRAMEIIDELEPDRRSFYAGCVGYFSAGGSMDTCITLRTGLIKDNMLYVQAGGGVVADSSAEGEYQESLNKAKALMRAAEEAARFV